MNVLVTGGAGYIGSHTCKGLSTRGHKPVVVDDLSSGHEWAAKWGPFYEVDIHDSEMLEKIMIQEKIDAVIHFAAFAYVNESVLQPLKYYENNVNGTVLLLKAMSRAGVEKIVFSSTCATYGVPQNIPIRETDEQLPVNPYGKTKLVIEGLLRDLSVAEKLQSVSLRYFNAAGADKDLEIGEDHNPETHLIPLTLEAAMKNKHVKIYGTDYSTPDGTCVRDYIHVSDLAEAHVLALNSIDAKTDLCRAYNLGTGHGYSVREIIQAVQKVTSKTIKIENAERRLGDPPSLVANAERALKDLGWRPQHSSLENIVATAANWYEKHHLRK